MLALASNRESDALARKRIDPLAVPEVDTGRYQCARAPDAAHHDQVEPTEFEEFFRNRSDDATRAKLRRAWAADSRTAPAARSPQRCHRVDPEAPVADSLRWVRDGVYDLDQERDATEIGTTIVCTAW